MYYTVQHNVTTDVDSVISQVTTELTIDGAQPGHVYYIEVTAVNILGPGPPRTTCEVDCIKSSEYKTTLIYHCRCRNTSSMLSYTSLYFSMHVSKSD